MLNNWQVIVECNVHTILTFNHSTGNEHWNHSSKNFCITRILLPTSLRYSQPVNCIFWSIKTSNWVTATSKQIKYTAPGCTEDWCCCSLPILRPNWQHCEKNLGSIPIDGTISIGVRFPSEMLNIYSWSEEGALSETQVRIFRYYT